MPLHIYISSNLNLEDANDLGCDTHYYDCANIEKSDTLIFISRQILKVSKTFITYVMSIYV